METLLNAIIEFWYILLVVFILGRVIYYPNKGKPEFLFTYLMLAAIISILCLMISRTDFSIGFALGIFAVFSIIRYRTLPISPREMTYIFLAAGIAAKNALVPDEVSIYKIVLTDVFILLTAWISEYFLFRNKPEVKMIVYDNLDLIRPDNREQLKQDLQQRFGIPEIKSIKIGKVDTIKNSVRLMVTFTDSSGAHFADN